MNERATNQHNEEEGLNFSAQLSQAEVGGVLPQAPYQIEQVSYNGVDISPDALSAVDVSRETRDQVNDFPGRVVPEALQSTEAEVSVSLEDSLEGDSGTPEQQAAFMADVVEINTKAEEGNVVAKQSAIATAFYAMTDKVRGYSKTAAAVGALAVAGAMAPGVAQAGGPTPQIFTDGVTQTAQIEASGASQRLQMEASFHAQEAQLEHDLTYAKNSMESRFNAELASMNARDRAELTAFDSNVKIQMIRWNADKNMTDAQKAEQLEMLKGQREQMVIQQESNYMQWAANVPAQRQAEADNATARRAGLRDSINAQRANARISTRAQETNVIVSAGGRILQDQLGHLFGHK